MLTEKREMGGRVAARKGKQNAYTKIGDIILVSPVNIPCNSLAEVC